MPDFEAALKASEVANGNGGGLYYPIRLAAARMLCHRR
jgi:hypothetical protein